MAEKKYVGMKRRHSTTKVKTRAIPKRRPVKGQEKRQNEQMSTLGSLLCCIFVLFLATAFIIEMFDKRNSTVILGSDTDTVLASNKVQLYLVSDEVPKVANPGDMVDGYLTKSIQASENDYNWEKLYTNGLYRYYCEDQEIKSKVGVDVSYYQGKIDWKKVKEDGVDFAIIRLGFRGYVSGAMALDERYKENMKNATKAGLDVGVYFFTQAVTVKEAQEEADFVLDNLGDYKLKYPIVIDTEAITDKSARSHSAELSVSELTNICKAFCDRIDKAGYTSSIYASKSWFINNLDLEKLEGYNKWLAHYTNVTSYPFEFDIWQYTDAGKVDGISGKVDLNICFKDY